MGTAVEGKNDAGFVVSLRHNSYSAPQVLDAFVLEIAVPMSSNLESTLN